MSEINEVKVAEPVQIQKQETTMQRLGEKIKRAPLSAKIIGSVGLAFLGIQGYQPVKKVWASVAGESAISTAEAQSQVGKTVTVEFAAGGGKYFERSKRLLINEGTFPNHTFTVMTVGGNGTVPPSGTKVRATGVVTMRDGKPQLVCKPEDVKY